MSASSATAWAAASPTSWPPPCPASRQPSATTAATPCSHGATVPTPFDRIRDIQCPVLGHYGAIDANPSVEDRDKIDAEMRQHGKAHEIYTYPNADHGFMNRRGPRYNEEGDKASWPRTLDFFARTLQAAPRGGRQLDREITITVRSRLNG